MSSIHRDPKRYGMRDDSSGVSLYFRYTRSGSAAKKSLAIAVVVSHSPAIGLRNRARLAIFLEPLTAASMVWRSYSFTASASPRTAGGNGPTACGSTPAEVILHGTSTTSSGAKSGIAAPFGVLTTISPLEQP